MSEEAAPTEATPVYKHSLSGHAVRGDGTFEEAAASTATDDYRQQKLPEFDSFAKALTGEEEKEDKPMEPLPELPAMPMSVDDAYKFLGVADKDRGSLEKERRLCRADSCARALASLTCQAALRSIRVFHARDRPLPSRRTRSCCAHASQVKMRFRKLSLKWHPDKNMKREKEAAEVFRAVHAAYHFLTTNNFDYKRWAESFVIPPMQVDTFALAPSHTHPHTPPSHAPKPYLHMPPSHASHPRTPPSHTHPHTHPHIPCTLYAVAPSGLRLTFT